MNSEQDVGLLVARFTAFASLGVVETAQQIAMSALRVLEGADPDIVAEETLAMVSVATARASSVALQEAPSVATVVAPTLLDLPQLFRDYIVAGVIISQGVSVLADQQGEVQQRLARKIAFYGVHFPDGVYPGPSMLAEKLELWIGRVSPPGLPVTPARRLADTGAVGALGIHLRAVLGFGRQFAAMG